MLRILCVVMLLGIAAGTALADVIDVTVNGSVSGSGFTQGPCTLGSPGCTAEPSGPARTTIPFSLSGTDTQLGSSSFTSNPTLNGSSVFATEDTVFCIPQGIVNCPPGTGEALYIDLTDGYNPGGSLTFVSSATESMSISFSLTDPSLVTLYGGEILGTASNGGEVLDSMGNIILQPPVLGDASAVLQPGAYQLDASVGATDQVEFSQSGDITNSELFLTAQFSPVPTPESRWTILAALLPAILAGYVLSHRPRAY